jgi:sec-independent protein translocase protein TatB
VFDIAFSELVVIGIIALVVLGPKRLPEVARTAGRWAGRLRRFVEDVKRDMDAELRKDELAELRKVKDQLVETRQVFEEAAGSTLAALPSIQPPVAGPAVPVSPPNSESVAAKTPAVSRKPSAPRKPAAKKTSTARRAKHGRTTRKSR